GRRFTWRTSTPESSTKPRRLPPCSAESPPSIQTSPLLKKRGNGLANRSLRSRQPPRSIRPRRRPNRPHQISPPAFDRNKCHGLSQQQLSEIEIGLPLPRDRPARQPFLRGQPGSREAADPLRHWRCHRSAPFIRDRRVASGCQ